jgi:TolB-like protein
VFSERFYVEGVASDNLNVGRIVINNKEVFVNHGKKIFFSKVVNLREGKNNITVDVYDTSDNKTTKTFLVTRKIPAVMQNASRMSITILPFDEGKGSDRAKLAYEQLIGAFVDQKRFSVIERAKLEQILMEQKLTKEKLTDPEHSIRVGKLMSADAVLAAAVREDAKSIEIVARVISTETSEVLDVKDAFAEDKSLSSVREIMADLASKFATGFPVIEGMVVKASGKDAVMDVGEASNIKKNMTVIFFRKGEEIKHPVTGKSLGFDTIKLAEGRVEDVQAAFSKVRLLNKPAPKDIRVKDLVITK